jgi:hypothetical protein
MYMCLFSPATFHLPELKFGKTVSEIYELLKNNHFFYPISKHKPLNGIHGSKWPNFSWGFWTFRFPIIKLDWWKWGKVHQIIHEDRQCRLLTLSLLMSYTVDMELLVKPEMLTSCIYMDLCLVTLKAISFYLLHNVSTLNQCRKLSCHTVVCKHFASYQGYPNYRWDLIWYAKG